LDAEAIVLATAGAFVGVIGWLGVGLYIQRREHARRARDSGRAVYFELGSNLLCVFMALEHGTFAPLSRATFDRLLPELSTWLPAEELQALALAYLGHGGYEQLAEADDLPKGARKSALSALLEAHRTALDLLRTRVFSPREIESINRYAGDGHARLLEEASRSQAT
jgi:hypothetical protein